MIGPMLKELLHASGTNQKQAILRKYSGKEMRVILNYTYNMEFVYHVKPSPGSPLSVFDRTDPLNSDEIILLHNLRTRQVTGNAAREAVDRVVAAHGSLIKLILGRDLQCGIAATTINKVMPGLIPQFKVQLAKEVLLDKIKFPMLAQLKYDGVRLITTIRGGKVKFRTRNGKVVHLPNLAKKVLPAGDGIMLDGELTIRNGTMAERTSVSGMVNSAMHGGIIDESKLEYALFDSMPLGAFENCSYDVIYSTRHKLTEDIVKNIHSESIVIADIVTVKSVKQVEKLSQALYAQGMEGLVLKHATHKYSFKRSKDWIKIKETKTADLVVWTYEEGTGKYENLIGALYCKGVVEGKTIGVFVGTGLSDEQRAMPFSYFANETVEVKYNSIIRDSKTGKYSLFLPRYVALRHDK